MAVPLRDCKAWADLGLPMSTTSNEACKLFDSVMRQFLGFYEDVSDGDLGKNMSAMLAADENFLMGHLLTVGGDLLGVGTSTRVNPKLAARVDNLVQLSQKDFVLGRERKHVEALKLFADGHMKAAAQAWDDILIECPRDPLAFQSSHAAHFYSGQQQQHRDIISRILPFWDPSMPFYDKLLGYHAFGFVETNMVDRAEEMAKKGLELNRNNVLLTHSLSHVYEVTGRFREGRSFMRSTENDWCNAGVMSCHLYWHLALFDMEGGNYDDAVKLFDVEINKRMKSGSLLNITDACSLLFRLELEGFNVQDRWKEVYDLCLPHKEDHISLYNDAHLLMAFIGSKDSDLVKEFMTSLKQFASTCINDNARVCKEVGLSVCDALVAYSEGKFDVVVDLLAPVRYQILKMGNSDAQRDTFNLFLIVAAIKSPRKQHRCFARQLLLERKALREGSQMSDRFLSKIAMLHLD